MCVKMVKIERRSDGDLGYHNKALAHITGNDGKITHCDIRMTPEQVKEIMVSLTGTVSVQKFKASSLNPIISSLNRVLMACKELEVETTNVADISESDKQTMFRMYEEGCNWMVIMKVFSERYPTLSLGMLHKIVSDMEV